MTELFSWPLERERRAYLNPVFSPPQELGYPRATHGARSELVPPRWSRALVLWPPGEQRFCSLRAIRMPGPVLHSSPAA